MSDNEIIIKIKNWMGKVEIDVSECEEAINNNDMSRMESAGRKMEDDCNDALQSIESINVTIEGRNIKTLAIEILTDFRNAGRDCQDHNADSAMDHINSGKNNAATLGQDLLNFANRPSP